MEPEKEYLSWDELEDMVVELGAVILSFEWDIKSIYGVPRGGLIPAVMLSHILGLPLILDLEDGMDWTKILVVDDISDSGKTLAPYQDAGHKIVTLHMRPTTTVRPHIFHSLTSKWIVYPWETDDSSKLDREEQQ